jgi:hypothetical protein
MARTQGYRDSTAIVCIPRTSIGKPAAMRRIALADAIAAPLLISANPVANVGLEEDSQATGTWAMRGIFALSITRKES